MDPLTMAGLAVGSGAISIIGDKLFGPDDPDYVSPVKAEYERQRQKARSVAERRADKAEASAAAQGLSSSGQAALMRPLYGANNDMMGRLATAEADAVRQAAEQEEGVEQKRKANRVRGISKLAGQIPYYYMLSSMNQTGGNQPSPETGPGGTVIEGPFDTFGPSLEGEVPGIDFMGGQDAFDFNGMKLS